MTLVKDVCKIEKKLQDLERSTIIFEKNEFIERGNCKRNIRRKDMTAASRNATKCIGLSRKSLVYTQLCQRLQVFLDYVHENSDENVIPVIKNIERSLSQNRFDMLELHLETFEQLISKEEILRFGIDSEENKSDGDMLDSQTAGVKKTENTSDMGNSLRKKRFYSKRTDPNKENYLIMFKVVPQEEVNLFLSKMSAEVAEEDKSFMFIKQ